MKKIKKLLAWTGILILAALYVTTFILGLFGSPKTQGLLMACIVCTVVVPVLMYGMILLARLLDRSRDEHEKTEDKDAGHRANL